MNNTNNNTGVREQSVSSSQPVGHSSVGLAHKEQEPESQGVATSEFITSEAEPLDREVRDAGVEQVSDRLPLTDEHKAVGIQHAPGSIEFPSQPPAIKIEEIKKGLQISPAYSTRWLAELGRKVLKGLGLWKEK